jgi:pimeloyl-ACP methyl ester carboxylesterase
MTRFLSLIIAVMMLAHCGAPTPPQCISIPRSSRQPAPQLIAEAHAAWNLLENSSRRAEWPAAQARYNIAVGKLFDQLRCPARPWAVAAAAMGTQLAPREPKDARLDAIQVMFPARTVDTDSLGPRKVTPGLGLPIVGWCDQSIEGGERRAIFAPPTGQPFNVTALLRFDRGAVPSWQFCAPLQKAETTLGSRSVRLSADWSAGHAFYWKMCLLDDLTIQNVLLPERFQDETGLYFGQPYDPERIPVVFVHGVNSSPATFKEMVNELAGQEWFRKKYQVWYFNYPTGNPWIVTSAAFRGFMSQAKTYANAHGDHGNIDRTIIVAHSMGGLVTRSTLCDPKQCFYNAYFKKPFDQLKLDPRGRALIQNGLLYKPVDYPARAIFLAVPHQGSPLAARYIFSWLSNLIKLPKRLTVNLVDITLRNAGAVLLANPNKLPTAIDTLTPNDPSIRALQEMKFPKRIRLNSIIGDLGRGNSPNSTDGIVPYWSSHLEGVESEKIVPSSHSITANPQAIQEVERILLLGEKSN